VQKGDEMKHELVGLVGLGSLGSRLAAQIVQAGFGVVAFDGDASKCELHLTKAVDSHVAITPDMGRQVRIARSAAEVFEACAVVHWAAPSASLNSLNDVHEVIVVLHDSVMHESRIALGARDDAAQFAIAHCLMNDARRVFVASDQANSGMAARHFESIGLAPKLITMQQHDRAMAQSQGVLAQLLASGLAEDLGAAHRTGDLTPSGRELYELLLQRKAKWTHDTIKSILANPELKQILK